MRAIILAAGRGSRMGGLTCEQPKCLTPIAGRTLLDWQLAALRAAGIRDIALVRGYLAHCLQPADCTFFENPRWAETNMVTTLTCADEWLKQHDCLISYSDIVYHPDIITQLSANHSNLVISYDQEWLSLWKERFADPLEDAETFRLDAVGHLSDIGSRTDCLSDIEGQYMGLLKTTPVGWQCIRQYLEDFKDADRDRLDMTTLLQSLLSKGTEIQTTPIQGRWCEVDNEIDLQVYKQLLAENQPWSHDWHWKGSCSNA